MILETRNLTKRFGGFTALNNVSIGIHPGALTSVIGPNGAGKSTFFNLVTGAFPPTHGTILFEGQDITRVPQHRFARLGIAKSFQITNVFPALTALENVRVAAQALVARLDPWRPRARLAGLVDEAHALLTTVGLDGRATALASALAHGEQRALELAMALAARPRLLLLDEPTAGMSPEETRTIMDLILRLAEQRSVVLVEHKMKLVMNVSQRLLVLHHGEVLAEGTPDDIRANDEVKRVYLGQRPRMMLSVDGLQAWYGTSHALQGVTLQVQQGEIVCLVGRNGAGKTTTLKAIMGLLRRVQGTVTFENQPLLPLPAHARYRRGLAYVPEERRIVPGLTVRENLTLGLLASPNRRDEARIIERLAETFPRLAERLSQQATTMSGGEQQMLAIARALAASPRLIMLDEPSEGIMPVLVDEMFDLFTRLRAQGTTILLVEQNVELALAIADRAYVLDQGVVVHAATAASMLADKDVQERYCSV